MTKTRPASQIPFGDTRAYSGDSTQLLYLRARYYASGDGRFLSRDTWKDDKWGYAGNNPINYIDPSGHSFEPPSGSLGYAGPELFMGCFALHSLLKGNVGWITAGEAVQVCQNSFRQDTWAGIPFDLNTSHLPTSAHNLFGRFMYESYAGRTNWLVFNANEPLTQELASGALVNDVRIWYYFGGDPFGVTTPRYAGGDTSTAILYHFNKTQFAATMLFDIWDSIGKGSLPLEFVMGSFKFQVMKVGEDRLGFRIDNDMTIESGTHIVGRDLGPFRGSVEELIKHYPYLADRPLSEVINKENINGFPPISILKSRKVQETPLGLGGGSLYQTFVWTERYDPCNLALYSPILINSPWRDIQIWGNYVGMTKHPGDPFP